MPRVQINLQDIDDIEEWEDDEGWEELIGLRQGNERLLAQQQSSEVRDRKRMARGSTDALIQRRSERRKTVRRGGKRT